MSDTIKGSIIGALITVVGSILVFILGNFSTQSTIEEKTIETLSGYFDSVDNDMTYEQALQTIYKENENLKIEIDSYKTQLNELSNKIDNNPSEIELQNSTKEINKKTSALIANLTPISGEIERVWSAGEKDNYGNTYSSGICLHQVYSSAAHVVYSLDGKYKMLTGKFVLDEESKNTDGNYVLYAYSLIDGDMSLIYTSKTLSTATRPIDIEIDVSNVMDLVLEVYDPNKSSDNANTGLVDAKLE